MQNNIRTEKQTMFNSLSYWLYLYIYIYIVNTIQINTQFTRYTQKMYIIEKLKTK